MLIISLQGNANWNDAKIYNILSRMAKIFKNWQYRVLARTGAARIFIRCWQECSGTITWKRLAVSHKVRHAFIVWPQNSILREMTIRFCLHKDSHTNAYLVLFTVAKKWKQLKCPHQVNEYTVVFSEMDYYSAIREQTTNTHNNMNISQKAMLS